MSICFFGLFFSLGRRSTIFGTLLQCESPGPASELCVNVVLGLWPGLVAPEVEASGGVRVAVHADPVCVCVCVCVRARARVLCVCVCARAGARVFLIIVVSLKPTTLLTRFVSVYKVSNLVGLLMKRQADSHSNLQLEKLWSRARRTNGSCFVAIQEAPHSGLDKVCVYIEVGERATAMPTGVL